MRQQMEEKAFSNTNFIFWEKTKKNIIGHIKYLHIQAKKCYYATRVKMSLVKKQDLLKLFTRPRPSLLHTVDNIAQSGKTHLTLLRFIHSTHLKTHDCAP